MKSVKINKRIKVIGINCILSHILICLSARIYQRNMNEMSKTFLSKGWSWFYFCFWFYLLYFLLNFGRNLLFLNILFFLLLFYSIDQFVTIFLRIVFEVALQIIGVDIFLFVDLVNIIRIKIYVVHSFEL